MQVTHLNQAQGVEALGDYAVLTKIEAPGVAVTYLMTRDGVDVVLVMDSVTGESMVIEPDSVDHDRGGSIHDQARGIFGNPAPGDNDPDVHVGGD